MATDGMRDRGVMVTGSTTGIGLAVAQVLAAMGARVAIVASGEDRGRRALERVRAVAEGAEVELLLCDLASMASVRRLAADYMAGHDRLHVLVNNAAVVKRRREVTVDGLEVTFAVNHLAPFLLTNLLLPVLRASAPSRIVNVSSGLHGRGRIHLDDLQLERGFGPYVAYDQSKLANVLFTVALAERLGGTGVTANACHPGLIDSELGREMSAFQRTVKRWISRPTEEGARTPVYLASSPEVEGVTGKYFRDLREVAPSIRALDRGMAERLWAASARLAGLPEGP